MHDKVLQHRVDDAPCDGFTAKALGKYKLEEQLPGLLVKFVSCQEADDKPARALADTERVTRGSILIFSVSLDTILKQQRQHNMLLKSIYKERVRTVISKYSARFLKAPVDNVKQQQGGIELFSGSNSQRVAHTEAALTAAQSSMSGCEFAAGLDSFYVGRNHESHVNTSEWLEAEMREMCDHGVPELLEADMPLECMIIKYHEVFLPLLS